MDPELREEYQSIILDHDRNPRNMRALDQSARTVEVYNPLCGDRYTIYARLAGGRLEDVSFEGLGCAISRASASIMTSLVVGKTQPDVADMIRRCHVFLSTGRSVDPDLGDLVALQGVRRIPTRQRCALLAWEGLRQLMAEPD